jgi:hypothetical protein
MDVGPIRKVAVLAAIVGWVAFAILGVINIGFAHDDAPRDFFMSYLVGFVFWSSLPFGSLALLFLGIVTTASWSVVLRRILQASVRTMPLLALLFIPVVVSLFYAGGTQSPYWWSNKVWVDGSVESVAEKLHVRHEMVEENREKIHGYDTFPILTGLNPQNFLIRGVLYFAVMGVFAYLYLTWVRPVEDSNDKASYYKLRGLGGPGLLCWTLMMTFAVTDWVMSAEPTWASTMFPVIFGMNQFLTTFALSIFLFYTLYANNNDVMAIVKDKFRIDMGSLIFGFTMVWAYATFCQYMLVWAGNLPEELSYYRKRADHGWQYLAYFLMAFHWFFPFIVLLFREVKLNPQAMRWMCLLLLTVCGADIIWWIQPAVQRHDFGLHVPMSVAAIIGVGGLWGMYFSFQLAKRPILANNDETKFLATWGHH